jgi:hypothetical protein
MKTYEVKLPITGYISGFVEAESEEDAYLKFHDQIKTETTGNYEEFAWETHKEVCQGNVFSGELNDMEIRLVDED